MQDYRPKERNYAYIFELHYKTLSKIEKKCQDRAIKKCKKNGKDKISPRIVDSSPTDSDIAMKQILKQTARKALALGKRVEFQFLGNEEDVIEDFVKLELQQD
ncbi:hypothetical protein V6N13_041401 [Hibiscus sabdariffa]|uniref:Uncharacterized protein n=1 Tax=Hibiscus sabdariffa TaxID=183260 RepID=A0ABR2RB66_9ROSI